MVASNLRVLIADDDPIIRLDLKQMFENIGYQVVAEAGDGYLALQLAQSERPDICILDIKMPILDGIDVAQRLSEEHIAPVVLLTAYGDRDLIQRARESGAYGFLVKPFKSTDLEPAIEVARSQFLHQEELRNEVVHLQNKLQTRVLVDRAKGILIDLHGYSEAIAFRMIQNQAMQTRKTMRETAESILLTYETADS